MYGIKWYDSFSTNKQGCLKEKKKCLVIELSYEIQMIFEVVFWIKDMQSLELPLTEMKFYPPLVPLQKV